MVYGSRLATKASLVLLLIAPTFIAACQIDTQIKGGFGEMADVGLAPPSLSLFFNDEINLEANWTGDVLVAGCKITGGAAAANHTAVASEEVSAGKVTVRDQSATRRAGVLARLRPCVAVSRGGKAFFENA